MSDPPAPNDSGQTAPPSHATVVAKGSAINFLGTLIGIIDTLFLVAISWVLGEEILGTYILASQFVVIALRLSVLGLDKGLLRHVPMADLEDANSASAPAHVASVVGTAFRVTVLLSLVATGILIGVAPLLISGDAEGSRWLALMALALPGSAVTQLFLFALRGRSDMLAFVIVKNIAIPALLFLTAVPAYGLGFDSDALIIAFNASAYLGAVVAFWLFKRRFTALTFGAIWRAPIDRDLIRFSLPQGLTEPLNFLLSRIDVIMIAAFFPDARELVAFYGVAAMIGGVVKKVRLAFGTSLAPVLSGLMAEGNRDELVHVYRQVARWTLTLYLAVAIAVSLAAPLVLQTFGDSYVAYWDLVPILAAGFLVNAAAGPAQAALLMAGHSGFELLNTIALNVLNVGLNVILIPRYGVYGAAIATATSLSVFNLVRIIAMRRMIDLSADFAEVARVILAAIVATVPGGLMMALWLDASLWISLAAGLVFLALYPFALWVFGARKDLETARRFVARVRAKRRARAKNT